MTNIQVHTFPSGVRLIHLPTQLPTAHFGVVIGVGSRDELLGEHGLAHFVEHMLFKGTTHRSTLQILNQIEDLGGNIDAYTTKEFIVLSTCVPKSFLQRSIAVVSDIIFNSQFPDKELENERKVILEEINMYNDTPSELIFDVFDEYHFTGHPIGRNILGSSCSLKKLQRHHFFSFWKRAINPSKVVLCSAGDFSIEKVIKGIEKYFPQQYEYSPVIERITPVSVPPFQLRQNRRTHQILCLMGVSGLPAFHPKSMALRLITAYLGGHSMNSRLNLILREKYGLVYEVETFFNGFSDCGLWGIYFGCDKKLLDKCLALIYSELAEITEKRFSDRKLDTLKKKITGQLTLESENYQSLLFSKAKTLLIKNRIYTHDEIVFMINDVTAEEILEVSRMMFGEQQFSTLIFE